MSFLDVNSKKYICLSAAVVAPVMLDFIQLGVAALFNMPPAEAATGQWGDGGEMKHAGSKKRWGWMKREGDR